MLVDYQLIGKMTKLEKCTKLSNWYFFALFGTLGPFVHIFGTFCHPGTLGTNLVLFNTIWYLLLYSGTCWCILVLVGVIGTCWCIPVLVVVFWYFLLHSGTFRCSALCYFVPLSGTFEYHVYWNQSTFWYFFISAKVHCSTPKSTNCHFIMQY